MNEWLIPGKRPIWDKSHPEMPFADCNWANESKEDTMSKRTNVQTANNTTETKENTMTNTNKPARLTRDEWKAQYIAGLKAKADELAKKHEGEELPAPVSLYHKLNAEREGTTPKALYASELEARVLALTCLENGWNAEYITANQAKEYGGEPAEGAVGVKLHGKNVARGYIYYNAAQIVWANGEPVWAEDVASEHQATYAQRDAERKANNAQRRANELARAAGMPTAKRGGKKKAKKASKPATKQVITDLPVAAAAPMPSEYLTTINALMEQNQQLIAALAAAVQSR